MAIEHPEWLKQALFYEIYPQSFLDTNEDGIGDLPGIIKKLDYIKDLGFNALWINPIFDSPFFDAGYDVRDFYAIAPRYGTMKDLTKLFKEAHKRGMHVLLDLVPGHTSTDCEWFKKSCQPEKNEYSDRYIWTDSVWKGEEDYPTLRGISARNGSVLTNFFSIQPALNYGFYEVHHPEFEEEIRGEGPQKTIQAMVDVITFYLKKGCDGFRVDMAGWLVKRDPEGDGNVKLWKQIFSQFREDYPEAAFISEWNNPLKSLKAGFDCDFLLQDLDSIQSSLCRGEHPYFAFDDLDKNANEYFTRFDSLYEFAKKQKRFLSLISGNHDTVRVGKSLNEEELKFYYTFMFTMPSVPFLYYGDEIGMKYLEGLTSVEGGYQRTGSRTPMQWDESEQKGFSSNPNTYIQVNMDESVRSVSVQEKDENSLLSFLKSLLAFKKDHTALDNDASYQRIETKNSSPIVYIRKKGNERLMIALNPSKKRYSISLGKFAGQVLFSYGQNKIKEDKFSLYPRSFIILK